MMQETSDNKQSNVMKEPMDIGLWIEDQGHPANYVGVNIKLLSQGSYTFSQRTLIDSFIADMGLTLKDISSLCQQNVRVVSTCSLTDLLFKNI